jgi:hypothetical protein
MYVNDEEPLLDIDDALQISGVAIMVVLLTCAAAVLLW